VYVNGATGAGAGAATEPAVDPVGKYPLPDIYIS
jgi:hypothetical protein